MISKKLEEMINAQGNAEVLSAWLYFSMSAYFSSMDLAGFASWMHVQGTEELLHADKMFKFLAERGGRVQLSAIEAPQQEWESAKAVLEHQLKHELWVTDRINDLMNQAIEERDHATGSFLSWYVDEQVEEVATAESLIKKIKMLGDSPQGLYLLDQELSQRVLTPPA